MARFQAEARPVLAAIEARGHRGLLVGGRACTCGPWSTTSPCPGASPTPGLSPRRSLTPPCSTAAWSTSTRSRPPAEPTNRRRLVRALEVTLGSGRPFSSFGPGLDAYPSSPIAQVGLRLPLELLDARIDARIDAMVGAGLLDEVRRLLDRAPGLSATARQALGYRELADHLEGRCSLEEALADTRRRTRRFARRQLRWFRRDPRISWLDVGDNPSHCFPDPGRLQPAMKGTLHLTKHHGLGNDFLLLVDLEDRAPVDAARARALCDRRRGWAPTASSGSLRRRPVPPVA